MGNLVTVPMETWTDELFMRAPGATPAGVEQALYGALRQFCKDSGAWIVELWDQGAGDVPAPFNLGADAPFYDLQAMLETERTASGPDYVSASPDVAITQFHTIKDYWPWDILYVRLLSYFENYTWDANPSLATQKVTKIVYPGQTPHSRGPSGFANAATGWPAVFKTYNERPGAFQLYPTLKGNTAEGEGVVPWVSLGFPRTRVAMGIPVVFERVWYEQILDGTLAKLLSQQDKPYTNPTLAQYHGRRFRNGISEARDMAQRQMSNSERGWQYPSWA